MRFLSDYGLNMFILKSECQLSGSVELCLKVQRFQ